MCRFRWNGIIKAERDFAGTLVEMELLRIYSGDIEKS